MVLLVGTASPARATAGDERWAAIFDGGDRDTLSSLVVAPDGGTVFVAGATTGATTGLDWVTIAYDAATGAQDWLAGFHGEEIGGNEFPASLSVDPAGTTVYVTGGVVDDPDRSSDWATIAYDATTGAPEWVTRQAGPLIDVPTALAVGRSGRRVYVTGMTGASSRTRGGDWRTVAYDADTGSPLWQARFGRFGDARDVPSSVSVGPEGARLFVSGSSNGHIVTLAYRANDGHRLWEASYAGPLGGDEVSSSTVSPDGRTIFITGTSPYATITGGIVWLREEFVTIAYRAGNGSERWFARYRGRIKREADVPASLGINLTGSRIIVTGTARYSEYEDVYTDLVTVAYRGTDGHRVWSKRRSGTDDTLAAGDVAVAPGTNTFVAASDWGTLLTIAYAPNGTELWEASYMFPGRGTTIAQSIGIAPDGTSVFVGGTGNWTLDCCGPDLATISSMAT